MVFGEGISFISRFPGLVKENHPLPRSVHPENRWLEDDISFWDGIFRCYVSFREGSCLEKTMKF